MALNEQQEYEEAKNQLIEILKQDPSDHWSLVILANIFTKVDRDYEAAERFLRKALSIEPNDPWALNSMGAVLFETNRADEGEEVFRRLIEAQPKMANPYVGLAMGLSNVEKEEEASQVIREMFRRAEVQDKRSEAIFDGARELYRRCQVRLCQRYQSSVHRIIQEFKSELEEKSGLPIRVEETDFADSSNAKIEIAWRRNRDHHRLLTKRGASEATLPHLMMHELMHLEMEMQAREAGNNRFFATTANTREAAIRSVGDEVNRLQQGGFDEDAIQGFILNVIGGLSNFLYNCPLDMAIESRMSERFSELRPYQYLSNAALMAEAQKGNMDSQIRKITPSLILNASIAMNGAFALFLDDLFGNASDFAGVYRDERAFGTAKDLYAHWKDNANSLSPGDEYRLVDDFADIVGLTEWYQWIPDDSQTSQPQQDDTLEQKSPASMFYLLGALERYENLPESKIREIAFEIALLGTSGLDYSSSEQKYSLRSIPNEKFTGLQLMCLMYVGFKKIAPEQETGMDLEEPYQEALKMFSMKKRGG